MYEWKEGHGGDLGHLGRRKIPGIPGEEKVPERGQSKEEGGTKRRAQKKKIVTVLYCIVMHCTTLYCTVRHCAVL